MKLKDFKHDVTATICRFEELHARITMGWCAKVVVPDSLIY